MGTFGSIESLISSLRAQSLAQQLIGHNIANSLTPGYSRRVPLLAEVQPGALGGVGSGVRFAGIERIRDMFLDVRARQEQSNLGERDALRQAVLQMQAIFPELNAIPGAGLMTALTTFFADWNALAAAPGSAGLRATLVADAQNLTTQFRDAHLMLRDIQRTTDSRLRDGLERINVLLDRVAAANAAVIRQGGVTGAAAQLDDRDLALAELAELIRIDVVMLGDGTALVMTGNARTLVRGSRASELVALADSHEPSFAAVGVRDNASAPASLISGEIRGGRVRGWLDARDGLIADELQELDQLANSLVIQTNRIHQGGYALDGVTTNTAFFTVATGFSPSEALDISVNSAVIGNPSLLAASRIYGSPANGEQALTLAALENLTMNAVISGSPAVPGQTIDPTLPMNSSIPSVLNTAPFGNDVSFLSGLPTGPGTLSVNGVLIPWDVTDSLNDIAAKINASFGPSIRAWFDWTSQEFVIIGDAPVTVYDFAGDLADTLRLQTRVRSLAPMNAGIGPQDRPIQVLVPLNQIPDRTGTVASSGGTVEIRWHSPAGTVNTTSVAWTSGQSLNAIRLAINAQLGVDGASFTFSFSPATQVMTINGTSVPPVGAANPVGPVEVRDATGNLSFMFNMEAQPRFGAFRDALLAQMQAQLDSTDASVDAATAAVAQIGMQQDAIALVNVDEEKGRLLEFLRAYEASVRALAAMDEALNTLINRMAASSFSGGPTQSVLTS